MSAHSFKACLSSSSSRHFTQSRGLLILHSIPAHHTIRTPCHLLLQQHSSISSALLATPPSAMAAPGACSETLIEFENQRGEKLVGTLTDPTSMEPRPQAAPSPQQHKQQQEQTAAAAGAVAQPGAAADAGAGASAAAEAAEAAASAAAPVVILAHGYMSSRNSELLVRLSTALVRSCQLSTFRFDFSGNGDSEGQFRYGQYRSEAEELGCAKQYLEQQLGRRVVAMLGHSKGATDVLLYAGCFAQQYGHVPCIVNLAARLDVRQGVVQRLGQGVLDQLDQEGQVDMQGSSRTKGSFTWQLRKEDLQDRLDTDVAEACRNIPEDISVLTVHGTADADVPVSDAREFDKLIKTHRLVVLDGVDHVFSIEGAIWQLAAAVLPFIHSHAVDKDSKLQGLNWLG